MLSAIAIVPSAPVLVPELAGAAAAEVADLTAAVLAAAALLPLRWIVVGTGAADGDLGPDNAGSFAGFGVDVRVGLSPHAVSGRAAEPGELPVCALLAGWVRGQARPDASAQVRVYAATIRPTSRWPAVGSCAPRSTGLPDPIGVLVVADGANTLTPAGPRRLRPRQRRGPAIPGRRAGQR